MRDKDRDMDEKNEDLKARSHGNPVVVNDPASELVDTDPAHSTPASPSPLDVYFHRGYDFSGASMGGQSLYVCLDCGALIKDESCILHVRWHEKVSG